MNKHAVLAFFKILTGSRLVSSSNTYKFEVYRESSTGVGKLFPGKLSEDILFECK